MLDRVILELAVFIAGFVICAAHWKMSKLLWLMAASMAVGLALSIWRLHTLLTFQVDDGHIGYALFYSEFYLSGSWMVFLTGLAILLTKQHYAIKAAVAMTPATFTREAAAQVSGVEATSSHDHVTSINLLP